MFTPRRRSASPSLLQPCRPAAFLIWSDWKWAKVPIKSHTVAVFSLSSPLLAPGMPNTGTKSSELYVYRKEVDNQTLYLHSKRLRGTVIAGYFLRSHVDKMYSDGHSAPGGVCCPKPSVRLAPAQFRVQKGDSLVRCYHSLG